MKKALPLWAVVLLLAVIAGGICNHAGATQVPVPIEKTQLVGSWQCTRFVFDNGMESSIMAKHQPMLVFKADGTVVSGPKTYQYEIHDNQVVLNHNGKPAGNPYLYDGKSLVLQGDDARVFYEKVK